MKEILIKAKGADLIDFRDIEPFQGNLKDLSKENYQKLKKEIIELGFSEPISVWKKDGKNLCLNGHQRLRALSVMSEEGYNIGKIPVNYIEAKDVKEAKKKVLALTSQYGNMTDDGLLEFMTEAGIQWPEIKDSFRFPEIDFKKFEASNFESEIIEDEAPKPPKVAITKPGDMWTLGGHNLLCGDSAIALKNAEKQDLCLTDPPYGIKRDKGFGGFGGFGAPIARRVYADEWDNERPKKAVFDLIQQKSNIAIIFGGNFFADILPQGNHWLVWDKKNTMPTFGDAELAWTNIDRNSVKIFVREYNGLIGKEESREHPTQKPVNLMADIVRAYGKQSKTVIDPFCGSGTTLIAAEQLERKCFAIEIEPRYCDVIVERWQNLTGGKAVRKTG